MYKSDIIDEKDIDVFAYIADVLKDNVDVNMDELIEDALDNYDSPAAREVWGSLGKTKFE